MEWLLFTGLIVGNFLTFGTIKVVKDNKTREFSLGKAANLLKEKLLDSKILNPIDDEIELLEQQVREEADELLEPYNHALRNIEEENRVEEQKITKIEKIIEAEKRKKELHESVKKLSEAAREFGISLEELEEGRETIIGGIGGSRQVYTYDPIKYEPVEDYNRYSDYPYVSDIDKFNMEYIDIDALHQELVRKKQEKRQQTQDWINTKIRAHNQPIIEKRLLRDLEDIVERIDKEDKRPLKQIDKILRNPEDLKNILNHHKTNTVKFEIATSLLYIILSELSYHQIVTDTTLGTHETISYATNLDIKTVLEYISVTELRNELRRHKFSTDNI